MQTDYNIAKCSLWDYLSWLLNKGDRLLQTIFVQTNWESDGTIVTWLLYAEVIGQLR